MRWILRLARFLGRQPWTRVDLLRALAHVTRGSGRWARELVDRLVQLGPEGRLAHLRRELARTKRLERLAFPKHPLRSSPRFDVPRVAHPAELAQLLDQPPEWLEWLVDAKGTERTQRTEALRHYRRWWIPRRSGPPRLVEAPKQRLKQAQRLLLERVVAKVPPHPASHGCIKSRSVHTHASVHAGRRFVARFDLSDFFASITQTRARGLFLEWGYPEAVAGWLAHLCTTTAPPSVFGAMPPPKAKEDARKAWRLHRLLSRPHLPQGAPTSPALANHCAFMLDQRLERLATSLGWRYSRFVDDLTFSGDAFVDLGRLEAQVADIASDEGFLLNFAKSSLRSSSTRQRVTGLVVNRHPQASRRDYDALRARLHQLGRLGVEVPVAPRERAALRGRLEWVATGNPARAAKLLHLFSLIAWPDERVSQATDPPPP